MKKILIVGENPFGMTGNGNFMAAILSSIDTNKYEIACFVAEGRSSAILSAFRPVPFSMIDAQSQGDSWGADKLVDLLQSVKIDVLLMAGIDLWRYAHIFQRIHDIRVQKGFKWAAIFPYDLQQVRKDWVTWINLLDYPCVYSQYGFDVLEDHVPKLRYFRPPLHNADLFQPVESDVRMKIRRETFKTIRDDDIVFGFVGANAFRKDIPRLIKAFLQARQEVPKIALYLHTELVNGAYNLKQMTVDLGGKSGDLLAKEEHVRAPVNQMVRIYNSMDCLVNCTIQEGLSWTLLEAMLTGTPVIASDTTAQTELVKDVGVLVPCNEQAYVHAVTGIGPAYIDAKACSVDAIRDALVIVAKNEEFREEMRSAGIDKAKEWLSGVSDINVLLAEATKKESVSVQNKINKVLFVQHSAAGDVLMTTQCFKGIKERHKGMELVYMTQPQYMDIVEGNPYIDEIVPWSQEEVQRYEIVYNPHGERILTGGFNSLDVTLYSMYPYFCKVEPDEMFIKEISPGIINTEDDYDEDERFEIDYGEWPKEYIVVHTTGGDPVYRTYPHMDVVLRGIDLPAVQLGSTVDAVCHKAMDLRGKLSFRESAWVVARAKGGIVIDSFMSHLCGALGTPVVVLYGPSPARVVCPRIQGSGGYVALEPNMLDVCKSMTRCWGVRNRMGVSECTSPCINTLNPLTVRKALLSLIEEKND